MLFTDESYFYKFIKLTDKSVITEITYFKVLHNHFIVLDEIESNPLHEYCVGSLGLITKQMIACASYAWIIYNVLV